MGKRFTIFFLLVWHISSLYGQENFSSHLPIVIIQTDPDPSNGQPMPIVDELKVGAWMKIIYVNDQTTNHLSDSTNPTCLNYDGHIGIETRGSTSQFSEKKSYGLETRHADGTNNNVSLMGLPKENDWVLNSIYSDPCYLRDCLTYTLGRRTGHYAPRTHYCEVFVNGDYRGLYMLTEKIKIDRHRVDIAKLAATDTVEPAVTGGYIFKADRANQGEPMAWATPSSLPDNYVIYILHDPKPSKAVPAQVHYIHSYFDRFQQAVADGDTSLVGYPSMIDEESFVDYMIINELASNVDAYQLSTFFHKDRDGELCAGPLWDFNFAYGNDFSDRSHHDQWQFANGSNTGSPFWQQLFNDPWFQRRLISRWKQLTAANHPLSFHNTKLLIDSIANHIYPALVRERLRWNLDYDYDNHIFLMKDWLRKRYHWINLQLTGDSIIFLEPAFYPNPTTGIINFAGQTGNIKKIQLFNIRGRMMTEYFIDDEAHQIDLRHFPDGIYILQIVTDDDTFTKKIVKAKH